MNNLKESLKDKAEFRLQNYLQNQQIISLLEKLTLPETEVEPTEEVEEEIEDDSGEEEVEEDAVEKYEPEEEEDIDETLGQEEETRKQKLERLKQLEARRELIRKGK